MEQSPAEIELAKIKAQNKARQAKYLEKRRAEGKRHLSAMVSGETYDKLCRLRDQSITAGKTKNLGEVLDELLNDNTATGQDQGSQIREDPIKAIADQVVGDIEEYCRENPSTIETQSNSFNESEPIIEPEPGKQIQKTQAVDLSTKPDREKDRPGYSVWLFNEIKRLNESGLGWAKIAEKFNADGIKPTKAKRWSGGGHLRSSYKAMEKKTIFRSIDLCQTQA